MRIKLIGTALALVIVGAAYTAGLVPERTRRAEAESRAMRLETQLALAEARLRGAALLGRVLMTKELAMRQDYGQASERSSALFDTIRQEAAVSPDDRLRDSLTNALQGRDRVTAGLAQGEPAAVQDLHDVERQLRRALGYDVPVSP